MNKANKEKKGLCNKCNTEFDMQLLILWLVLLSPLPVPELPTRASRRKDWKRISAESSLMSPRQPNLSRDGTELNFAVIYLLITFTIKIDLMFILCIFMIILI